MDILVEDEARAQERSRRGAGRRPRA
jgi:hypothetical protein